MSTNIERAAEVMMREFMEAEAHPEIATVNEAFEHVARALAEHQPPLLMPDGVTEEWEAVVAWRNQAGQTEQQHGRGVTRDEALDDARSRQSWLTDPVEVAHKCARRHTTPWEAEEVTHTEKEEAGDE